MQPIEESGNVDKETDICDRVFHDEDEMRKSLARFCYGDLYVIGKIWIQILKTVLVGAKLCLIPVVNAAQPQEPPKKPPPMKYKDLPIYQTPHYDYKNYESDKIKCPQYKDKLLHNALLPHVKVYRKSAAESLNSACCTVRSSCKDLCSSINSSKKDFKNFMRNPDNIAMRQAVVASGTLAGFLLGGGGGIPRRFIYTSIGALSTGALCFPKETDEYFREACYHTAKILIALYNSTCGKEFTLRERVPCKSDMPQKK